MPDRGINPFRNAAWSSTTASTTSRNLGSHNLVQIISGSLSNIKNGEIMQAVLQKAGNGAFKITLNGESFLIKGLPASMLGKTVSFIVQSSGQNKTELLWLANAASGDKKTQLAKQQASAHPSAQSSTQLSLTKHAKILSTLPANLKVGQTITARIDAIQGKQMSLGNIVQGAGKHSNAQILTSRISGMKEGDAIAGKIVAGANNKAMLEIITQQRSGQTVGNNMASFKLAVGDTVTAFVQQRLANGQIQLNIQGINVETAAPANINKGDALVLKMIKEPAGFQLLSLHKNAAATALTNFKANLASNNQPIAQNIAAMRLILPGLADNMSPQNNTLPALDTALKANEISPQQPLHGERLAHMIRNAGAGLESKLLQLSQNPALSPALQHDLKAIMLQLANQQGGNAQQHDVIKALRELGQQSVSRIETGQALNVLSNVQGEPMRLELPMLVNQQMVNVQLSIQHNAGYESESSDASSPAHESFSVLFALELSQLGHIRVDASISDSSVHARIYHDSAASHQFIQDNIQRLENRLQGLGFKEVYLISSHQQPETKKQRAFEQLTRMMPSSTSLNLVDIRI